MRGQLRVPRHATADLAGLTVLSHETHRKRLLTRLPDGLTPHTHLKMSGSWTVTRVGPTSCYLRGLNPWTPAGEVDTARLVARAATAFRHSARVSGALQVTTGDTRRGRQHWVAGRAGQPCLRGTTAIRVMAEGQTGPTSRRNWWCPNCQPARTARLEP